MPSAAHPSDEPVITRFEREHTAGFGALVADTLREFGFEPDAQIDPDLVDPAAVYTALWVALVDGDVVGSIALRDLGSNELQLKRMYLHPSQRCTNCDCS